MNLTNTRDVLRCSNESSSATPDLSENNNPKP